MQETGVEFVERLGRFHEELLELVLGIEHAVWILVNALEVGQDFSVGGI